MDIVDRLLRDRPIFHARGTERWDASASTLRAIQQAVREGDHSLEIGCGASSVVFAAQSARHTVISLDGEEHDRVRGYLKQIGIDDNQLVFIVGWSDQVLPRLVRKQHRLMWPLSTELTASLTQPLIGITSAAH